MAEIMAETGPLVAVIMGSKSDWETMRQCDELLLGFGVVHECRVLSAHRTPAEVAGFLGDRGIAVWDGDYYAVEVMRRLGLSEHGAVRVGIVHYNTAEEVNRLLAALHEL